MGGFSGSFGSLWVEVGAKISKFDAAMAEVSKTFDTTISDVQKRFAGFDKIGDQLKGVGVGLSAAITLPLIGIGVASTKMATDFQAAMNKVAALGDVTGENLKQLQEVAIELGAKTKFSATEAAQGMAELSAAGFDATKVLSALPAVLDLAAAGELSIARAAEITTDVLTQFGLEANKSAHIADVLAKAAADSKTNVAELGVALGIAGPPARAAGLSLEQTASAMEIMANAGIRGEKAGTSLRGILISLAKPTDDAAKLLQQMGIKVSDASGKMLPLSTIVDGLSKKTLSLAQAATLVGAEGATGLLSLANKGGAALETLSTALVGADGDAKKMANTLQTGLPGALEKAKGSIETAGIVIGNALAPTIVKLAGVVEIAANKIAEFATWFQKLPEPVKNTAFALAAVAAAIGPLLVVAGTLIGSLSSIYAGFGTLAGAGGIIPIVTTAMSASGIAAAVFIGAWAGWEVLKSIGDSLQELIPSFDGLQSILTGVHDPLIDAKLATSALGISLDGLRTVAVAVASSGAFSTIAKLISEMNFSKVTLSWDDFKRAALAGLGPLGAVSKVLQDIVALKGLITGTFSSMDEAVKKVASSSQNTALGIMKISDAALKAQSSAAGLTTGQNAASAAATAHSKALGENNKALTGQGKAFDVLSESVKNAQAKYTQVARAFNEGRASAEQLERAQVALQIAQDNLDPTRVLQRYSKAWDETSDRYAENVKQMVADGEKLSQINKDIEVQSGQMATAYAKAHESMRAESLKTIEIIVPLTSRIPAVVQEAIKANEKLEQAYKTLGQSSGRSLQDQANKSKAAYETIRDSGTAAASTLDAAWLKYEEDRQAAARAMGETIPEEQQKALDEMAGQIEGHHAKTNTAWDRWAKQVSTIISDLGKSIVQRFSSLGDQNKQLDKDAAALRDSLRNREQDYATFAVNVADTLAEAQASYKSDLAKDELALSDSLQERREDYADYAQDIADKLADFTRQNSAQAKKEKDALLDSLDDRTRDYGDYSKDVEQRIKDIRTGHAKSVKTESKNLEDSLADRKKDYDRYAQDVAIQISRVREKNKGGFSEEEADLLLSLARRKEDFQAYQTETATKITELTVKHKEEADEQERDQREALERRTRDFNLYRDEVTKNLGEVTAKYQEAQTKEEADLAASLDRKKAELAKYEVDVIAKFDGVRTEALNKLIKQESDLAESLGKQRKEWEAYKRDVQDQLQEIEDKHIGIFGKIASIGVGVFKDIGTAVARFVVEELTGKLFKSLIELTTDILPGVGKALAKAFGVGASAAVDVGSDLGGVVGGAGSAAGGAAGQVAGAGSSAGGVAGQAAGAAGTGVTAIVGAVAGVASAVSGIISNFQFAGMNKSLDIIVKHTLQTANDLANLRADEWSRETTLMRKLDDVWTSVRSVTSAIELNQRPLESLAASIPHYQERFDSIANSTLWGSAADKDNSAILLTIRDLLGNQQIPNLQVYINNVQQPTSAIQLKVNGGLI